MLGCGTQTVYRGQFNPLSPNCDVSSFSLLFAPSLLSECKYKLCISFRPVCVRIIWLFAAVTCPSLSLVSTRHRASRFQSLPFPIRLHFQITHAVAFRHLLFNERERTVANNPYAYPSPLLLEERIIRSLASFPHEVSFLRLFCRNAK